MTSIASLTKTARSLSMDAPWRWLGAGWRDLTRAPVLSIGYGLFVVGVGAGLIIGLWQSGLEALVPVAFGMFAIVGPLLALCTYELSRRLEAGESPGLFPVRFAGPRSALQIAYMGFFVMFAALVWARIAVVLYALFTNGTYTPISDFINFALTTGPGLGMVFVGTLTGGIIAFVIFTFTVISIPMLMNEKTDPFTAIAAGIITVKNNPGPMLLWAWLIAVLVVAGIASLFIGLAIVFPLLGHATWHAYRDIRSGAVDDV